MRRKEGEKFNGNNNNKSKTSEKFKWKLKKKNFAWIQSFDWPILRRIHINVRDDSNKKQKQFANKTKRNLIEKQMKFWRLVFYLNFSDYSISIKYWRFVSHSEHMDRYDDRRCYIRRMNTQRLLAIDTVWMGIQISREYSLQSTHTYKQSHLYSTFVLVVMHKRYTYRHIVIYTLVASAGVCHEPHHMFRTVQYNIFKQK